MGQVGEAGKSMPALLTLAFLYLSDDSNGIFLMDGSRIGGPNPSASKSAHLSPGFNELVPEDTEQRPAEGFLR